MDSLRPKLRTRLQHMRGDHLCQLVVTNVCWLFWIIAKYHGASQRCAKGAKRCQQLRWRFRVGLCTVYRIDGITVAVYGGRHRILRPSTAVNTVTTNYQFYTIIIFYYNLTTMYSAARRTLRMRLKMITSKRAMRIISARTWCVSAFVFIARPLRSIHDLENITRQPELGQRLATVTASYD